MKYYPLNRNYTYNESKIYPVNKVINNNKTLIDLTLDNIDPTNVLNGTTFHLSNGKRANGKANSILLEKLFPVGSILYTGTADNPASFLGGRWKTLELVGYDMPAFIRKK